MVARALADLVLLLHFGFILVAVFGGLLVLRRRWWAWVHLPVVVWASVVNLFSWVCPLTPLENYFRAQAGQAGYEGGFIEHYLLAMIYPGGMTRTIELVAAVSIVAWNVVVYGWVLYRLRQDVVKSERPFGTSPNATASRSRP